MKQIFFSHKLVHKTKLNQNWNDVAIFVFFLFSSFLFVFFLLKSENLLVFCKFPSHRIKGIICITFVAFRVTNKFRNIESNKNRKCGWLGSNRKEISCVDCPGTRRLRLHQRHGWWSFNSNWWTSQSGCISWWSKCCCLRKEKLQSSFYKHQEQQQIVIIWFS